MQAHRERGKNVSRPPDLLPPGFLAVWEVVKEADAKAPSRRALARRLGVSSFTLHRLLVTGDVPDLTRASVREQRAWIRTLGRIAHRLGIPSRPWLESAGIVWSPSVDALVSATNSKSDAAEDGQTNGPKSGPVSTRHVAGWRVAEADRPLRVGIGLVPGLSTKLPTFGDSFLGVLTRRLARSISPGVRLHIRHDTPGRLTALLRAGELDLGVGVWDLPEARFSGLGLAPIPGLAVPLRGFTSNDETRSWREIAGSPDTVFLVEEGSPAGDFLRTHCERRSEQVVEVPNLPIHSGEACAMVEERNAVLLLDAWSAWSLWRERGPETALRELVGLAEEGVLARLAIGLPQRTAEFLPMLNDTLNFGFLGANPHRTAELYCALLALPAADLETRGDDWVSRLTMGTLTIGTRLSSLPISAPRFLDRIAEQLGSPAAAVFLPERSLESRAETSVMGVGHPALPTAGAEATTPDPPSAGRTQLPSAARQADASHASAPPHPPQCQSCSVSLADFGGASDHYCRYCSDEHGHLRPLPEVREGIRQWMLSWQEGVTIDDIDERVGHFLRAMPAWAHRA